MACRYLWIGILFLLLIGVVSGYGGSSIDVKEVDLGPKMDIFNSHKQEVDVSSDVQENLVFKLTLTNNRDYWVCWDNSKYNLKIIHYGQNYDITQTLDGKNCIPPNGEITIWIPFETYNGLEEENRLGDWTIQPIVSLEGVSIFSSNDLTKDISSGGGYSKQTSFSGNQKEIKVVKEEPTTHRTFDDIVKWLTTGKNILITLGAGAAAILTIWALLSGSSTNLVPLFHSP